VADIDQRSKIRDPRSEIRDQRSEIGDPRSVTILIMSWAKTFYQSVFKRTSTFAVACIVGAVFFERGFAQGTDWLWGKFNNGKLYPDTRKRWDAVTEAGDDDDDDDE